METKLVVKSNINCENCLRRVTPFLDKSEKIKTWSVDTVNPDKLLTVTGEDITFEVIENILKPSGFKVINIDG